MSRRSGSWYDAQYNARAAIPEHPAILQSWFERSAQARAELPCVLDVAYGAAASETLDIFKPMVSGGRSAGPAPVLVYIHGGYWRALNKRDQSFVASHFAEAGAVVVLPNYALAPAVTVKHIVLQLVQAVAWVYRHIGRYGGDRARIVVAGHSAGGHLAAMMLACQWREVAGDLPAQVVQSALALSGVFELEPLRHAPFLRQDLNLSRGEAALLSPALMPAPAHGRLAALVGGDESSEFQRQNALIRQAWGAQRVTLCEAVPGHHHMSVLDTLACPEGRSHQVALQLLGLR